MATPAGPFSADGLTTGLCLARVTRASGKNYVGRRLVKNDRLNAAGHLCAFAALRCSTGADAHYRRRRDNGDWHAQALRNLFNRMLGQLFHCLQTGQHFSEPVAFAPPATPIAPAA